MKKKNDRVPWYKDVNNNSAAVSYNQYLKIKKRYARESGKSCNWTATCD